MSQRYRCCVSVTHAVRLTRNLALGIPLEQARDLFIAMMHGLTALHMANAPELPTGTGQFGNLIPAVLTLFQAAWCPPAQER